MLPPIYCAGGVFSKRIIDIAVTLFPQPLSPTTARISFRATEKLTLSRIGVTWFFVPKPSDRPLISKVDSWSNAITLPQHYLQRLYQRAFVDYLLDLTEGTNIFERILTHGNDVG